MKNYINKKMYKLHAILILTLPEVLLDPHPTEISPVRNEPIRAE